MGWLCPMWDGVVSTDVLTWILLLNMWEKVFHVTIESQKFYSSVNSISICYGISLVYSYIVNVIHRCQALQMLCQVLELILCGIRFEIRFEIRLYLLYVSFTNRQKDNEFWLKWGVKNWHSNVRTITDLFYHTMPYI